MKNYPQEIKKLLTIVAFTAFLKHFFCKMALKLYLSKTEKIILFFDCIIHLIAVFIMNIRLFIITLFLCSSVAAQQTNVSSLIANIQTANTDSAKIAAYGKVVEYYFFQNADSAAFYAGEGLKLAQATNNRMGVADMLCKLASVRESHGNLILPERFYKEALTIYHHYGALTKIAAVNNGLGVVAAKKGDFKTANDYFFTALKAYDQLHDEAGIASTYIKLGALNESIHELDKALEYYNKSKAYYQGKTLRENYITLYNNMGVVYAQKDSMDKAAKMFLEGVAISDSAQYAGIHIMLLTNVAHAYEELKKPQLAKEYSIRALSKSRQFKMPESEARSLMNLAAFFGSKDPGLAAKYLDTALNITISIDHQKLLAEVYGAIGALNKEQSRYKEALDAFEHERAIKDSIFNIQKASEIAALQTDYEAEEANMQIKQLKLTNEKTTLERNIGIGITTAILAILFTLLFSFIRLRKVNKKLITANQVRDKLFSIIGHDLKGPMASQTQMLNMLQSGDFSALEHKDIIQELGKQSEATLNILNALLSWGNIQLQGVKVNPVTFHARPTVAKTITLYAKQAEAKSISIHNNIHEGTSVFVDPDHFDFVIRNLLSNAIKFTPLHGGISLDAKGEPGEDIVTFSITDTGIGISAERQKLFQDDNMHVSYGTDGEKGTGLGLMLTKEFIESNGGKIWLTSYEGKGTTFFFSLPKMG